MMKCTDLQNILDEYLDDAIPLAERKIVEAHLEHCSSCQQALEENKTIRQALRSLPVEETSPDFEEKMFTAVRRHYDAGRNRSSRRHSGNRFITGFTTAIAASLALWFASTMYTPQLDQESPHVVNLAMNQVRTVKLMFEAPTDLAEVTLSIELPENIELEGYAGESQLTWQASLNKGQNVLALPVIAIGNGQGELVAQINYGDRKKQFHIVLKTSDDDGALIYKVTNLKTA